MDALDDLYRQPIPLAQAATGQAGGSKLRAAWTLVRGLNPGKGLMGRILFGCLCSALVGVVTNLPYLKLVILWICQVIIWVFGKPEMPPPVKEKVTVAVTKARDLAGRHEMDMPPAEARPARTLREAAASVEDKMQEKLVGAAAAKVKEKVQEKAGAVTHTVKDEARKIGDRMEAAAGGFRDAMGEHRQLAAVRQAEALRQAAERRADAERLAIIQLAVRHQIPWKDRPIEAVRNEVVAAEAEHAPNAQCPYCRFPLRLPPAADGRRPCGRCRRNYSVVTARSLGPPRPGLFRR